MYSGQVNVGDGAEGGGRDLDATRRDATRSYCGRTVFMKSIGIAEAEGVAARDRTKEMVGKQRCGRAEQLLYCTVEYEYKLQVQIKVQVLVVGSTCRGVIVWARLGSVILAGGGRTMGHRWSGREAGGFADVLYVEYVARRARRNLSLMFSLFIFDISPSLSFFLPASVSVAVGKRHRACLRAHM